MGRRFSVGRVSDSSELNLHRLGLAAWNTTKVLLLLIGFTSFSVLPVYLMPFSAAMLLMSIYLVAPKDRTFRLWMLYLGGFVLFAFLRPLADDTGLPVRFSYVIECGKALFGDTVASVWLQQRLYSPESVTIPDIVSTVVYLSFFIAPHIMAVVVWRRHPGRFKEYVLAMLGTVYAGLALYFLVPTAPPWLAAREGYLPAVVRIVPTVVDGFAPQAYRTGDQMIGPNHVAAMPSLHLAITCVVALATGYSGRMAGAVGVMYVLAMGFALAYLGERYIADEWVGVAIALGAWRIARRAADRGSRVGRVIGVTPAGEGWRSGSTPNERAAGSGDGLLAPVLTHSVGGADLDEPRALGRAGGE